jgi:aminoglycoside phosphotransferase (APT) family kinase protein
MRRKALTSLIPPAAGVRPAWRQVPDRVRDAVETRLGSPVVSATSQAGGFSPGVAARLRTADGQRVFAKIVGPEPNESAPRFHRREARVVAGMPEHVPAPRLLWSIDEGDEGWVALIFEDVEGRNPAVPWREDELDRVVDALARLATDLTPAPPALNWVGSASGWGVAHLNGWSRLQAASADLLDRWSLAHLDRLAELEADAPASVAGETLLHLDVRADNLLLAADRVWIVDWPHARIGAAWVDLVFFAPSVAMQGGPSPEALLARHPAARTADPAAITAAVAAVAGFFTWQATLLPPPGLPTLRAFQAAQGRVARRWLAERTGCS